MVTCRTAPIRSLTLVTSELRPDIHAFSWIRQARSEPARHRELATNALRSAGITAVERALLHSVLAYAALDSWEVEAALESGRNALIALPPDEGGWARAEVVSVLARALATAGQLDEALALLDATTSDIDARETGLLDLERNFVHYKRGDMENAHHAASQAVVQVPAERSHDRARALNGRAVVSLYLGDIDQGLRDFDEAEAIFRAGGMYTLAARVAHNQGMALARLGDVPAALDSFTKAEAELSALGLSIDLMLVARAEVSISVGLVEEVIEDLPPVIERLAAAGMRVDADEGRFYVAQAMLALGLSDTARFATATARSLRETGQTAWAALAEDVALQARLADVGPIGIPLADAMRVATALTAGRMRFYAAECWLRVAMIADAHGNTVQRDQALRNVIDAPSSLAEQVASHEAAGRLARLNGDAVAARRHVAKGLGLVSRHRVLFDATDLRVQASAWGDGLAKLAIGLEWRSTPGRLLAASEQWRATAHLGRTVRPLPDADLSALLANVRAAHAYVASATRDGASPAQALERVRTAEKAVADYSRTKSSDQRVATSRLTGKELREHLGSSTLIEFVAFDNELTTVVVNRRGVSRIDLGATAPIFAAATGLNTALRRLASFVGLPAGDLVARSAAQFFTQLHDLVAVPLQKSLGESGDVVVVPVDALHAVPWSALLGSHRLVSMTASARQWLSLGELPRVDGRSVVVAGPGLPGAEREAKAVARLMPDAQLLSRSKATVARVGTSMHKAAVAHLACHAKIRVASPLFSSLELYDGPATAYDLERLQTPSLVVLSACSSGVTAQRTKGEVLGLATVFLDAGTKSLVAATIPLPDQLTVDVMTTFHTQICDGKTVAESLARLVANSDMSTPEGLVTACALTCFGRGDWSYPTPSITPDATPTVTPRGRTRA